MQDQATESGINDVIGKPFNKRNVVDMILTWGTLRVEPLPQVGFARFVVRLSVPDKVVSIFQLNFGAPLFDAKALAAPDFVTSEPVRPKTAMALVVDDCKLTQHVICSLLKVTVLHRFVTLRIAHLFIHWCKGLDFERPSSFRWRTGNYGV